MAMRLYDNHRQPLLVIDITFNEDFPQVKLWCSTKKTLNVFTPFPLFSLVISHEINSKAPCSRQGFLFGRCS